MRFFIEKRQDDYGNRGNKSAVIEGVLEGEDIIVINPPEYAAKCSSVASRFYQEVSEEAGPARLLDPSGRNETKAIIEMDSLIEKYAVH